MKYSNVIDAIKDATNIAISGHVSPDGDSIGSSLALAHALKAIGKNPTVIIDNPNDKYRIIPGWQFVYDGTPQEASAALSPDLFIAVDCGDATRLGDVQPLFEATPTTALIDHHINQGFATYNYIEPTASSTCEMLYDIISDLCTIDVDIASCLYAGIVTDTGGFRQQNTTSKTFQVASKLVTLDIPFVDLFEQLLFSLTLKQFNGFITIVNDYVYVPELNVAYTTVTSEQMSRLQVTKSDLDGVSNMLRRIKEVEIAIFAYENEKGKTKISLRSNVTNINEVAKAFGGGGHKLASGAELDLPPDQAVQKVIEKIRELKG